MKYQGVGRAKDVLVRLLLGLAKLTIHKSRSQAEETQMLAPLPGLLLSPGGVRNMDV